MYIDRTNSTNTLMKELLARGEWPEGERWLRTDFQSAGRGQAGNSWESAPGKNLLCSILIDISRWHLPWTPFLINVAVCVALYRMIQPLLPDVSGLSIKWPNDIYYGDKKLAGILIENVFDGYEVQYTIAGIGLNVNQRTFRPDLVNPVSMALVSGENYTPETELEALCGFLAAALGALAVPEETAAQARRYRDALYRLGERHEYVRCADGIAFHARIRDVDNTGRLLLENEKGERESFAFKEISFVI